MKISLASHGGWAAPLRRPPLVLDTDALPAPAAAEAERLAAAAEAAAPALAAASESAGPDKRAPEAMRYTVTLDYGDRQVKLAGSDLAEGAEFAALRGWIEAQCRKP